MNIRGRPLSPYRSHSEMAHHIDLHLSLSGQCFRDQQGQASSRAALIVRAFGEAPGEAGALAVCRLMTNSNLVDCKTGR